MKRPERLHDPHLQCSQPLTRRSSPSHLRDTRTKVKLIWITVCAPPVPTDGSKPTISRGKLTEEKKRLIRLIVAFVIATKHHLRAEGGVHHEDLDGLLPSRLAGSSLRQLKQASGQITDAQHQALSSPTALGASLPPTPGTGILGSPLDEESSIGVKSVRSVRVSPSVQSLNAPRSAFSDTSPAHERSSLRQRVARHLHPVRAGMKRRPTNVRVVVEADCSDEDCGPTRPLTERTPLIKAGVKPDIRRTTEDVVKRAEVGLGRMVELGLPLIM